MWTYAGYSAVKGHIHSLDPRIKRLVREDQCVPAEKDIVHHPVGPFTFIQLRSLYRPPHHKLLSLVLKRGYLQAICPITYPNNFVVKGLCGDAVSIKPRPALCFGTDLVN